MMQTTDLDDGLIWLNRVDQISSSLKIPKSDQFSARKYCTQAYPNLLGTKGYVVVVVVVQFQYIVDGTELAFTKYMLNP
jgi:hypothetical protein